MDQLDENLRELKRRVDARAEQMLIVRQAQAAEMQALVTSHGVSIDKLEDQASFDLASHTRPALPLPRGDDPMIVDTVWKPRPSSIEITSGSGETETTAFKFTGEIPALLKPELAATADPIQLDPDAAHTIERCISHPPAKRPQGWLQQLIGRFRFLKP